MCSRTYLQIAQMWSRPTLPAQCVPVLWGAARPLGALGGSPSVQLGQILHGGESPTAGSFITLVEDHDYQRHAGFTTTLDG